MNNTRRKPLLLLACIAILPAAGSAESPTPVELTVSADSDSVDLRLSLAASDTARAALRSPDSLFSFPAASGCHTDNEDVALADGRLIGTYSYCCDGVSAGVARLDAIRFTGFEALGVDRVDAKVRTASGGAEQALSADNDTLGL
jgi:hypothetical protein